MWSRFQFKPGTSLADDGTLLGFHGDHRDIFAFDALEIACQSRNGASRPHAGNKNIHIAVRRIPDLWPGRLDMDLRIRRVCELVGKVIAVRVVRGQLFSLRNGARHTFRAFRQNQVGAKRLQDTPPLETHRGRHCQGDLVSSCSPNKCQRNPRVSTCGFDDLHARFE